MQRLKLVLAAASLAGAILATVATASASGPMDGGGTPHPATPAAMMATPTPTMTPMATPRPMTATAKPAMNAGMPGMPATGAPPGA
jgi:hypothetical protein